MTNIRALLAGRRFSFHNEKCLQTIIAKLLEREGIDFEREYRLGPKDIIDFYLPSMDAGLEVKIKGSTPDILCQLKRYLTHPEIHQLYLVTSHQQHAGLRESLLRCDLPMDEAPSRCHLIVLEPNL